MASSRPQVLVDALSVASGGGKSYAINLLRELEEDDRGFDFTIALPEDALEDLPPAGVRSDRVALPAPGNPLRIAGRILYEEFYVPASRAALRRRVRGRGPPLAPADVAYGRRAPQPQHLRPHLLRRCATPHAPLPRSARREARDAHHLSEPGRGGSDRRLPRALEGANSGRAARRRRERVRPRRPVPLRTPLSLPALRDRAAQEPGDPGRGAALLQRFVPGGPRSRRLADRSRLSSDAARTSSASAIAS